MTGSGLCAKVVVVDARHHMLGRLASILAKELLNGQRVVRLLVLFSIPFFLVSPPLAAASPPSLASIHSEFSSFHDVVVVLCTREGLRFPICLCLGLRERESSVWDTGGSAMRGDLFVRRPR